MSPEESTPPTPHEMRQGVERFFRRAVAVGGCVGVDVPDMRRGDVDGHRSRAEADARDACVLVGYLVGEGIRTDIADRRLVGEIAVRLHDDGAAVGGRDRAGHHDERAGAVDIGGAAEQAGGDGHLRAGRIRRSVGRVVDHEVGIADGAIDAVEGEIGRDRRIVGAVHGDVQRRRRGIAGLIAVQRIGHVECRGLAVLHVLEIGAERHHDLVRSVDADTDVRRRDAFAPGSAQVGHGARGDVVRRAVVGVERIVGQDREGADLVFGDGAGIVHRDRHVVDAVDGDDEIGG